MKAQAYIYRKSDRIGKNLTTRCPHGRKYKKDIIMVGSLACVDCTWHQSRDMNDQMVVCNHNKRGNKA